MPFEPGNKLGARKHEFAGAIRRHIARNPEDLGAVIAALFAKAKSGDVAAAIALSDRMDGKPTQTLASDPAAPIFGKVLSDAVLMAIAAGVMTQPIEQQDDSQAVN